MWRLCRDREFVVRAAQWLLSVLAMGTSSFGSWSQFDGQDHFPRGAYESMETVTVIAFLYASALLLRSLVKEFHPQLVPAAATGRSARRLEAFGDALLLVLSFSVGVASAAAIEANQCWTFGEDCGRVCFTLSTYCATLGEGAKCPQGTLRFATAATFGLAAALAVGLLPVVHDLRAAKDADAAPSGGSTAMHFGDEYSDQLQTSLVGNDHNVVPARLSSSPSPSPAAPSSSSSRRQSLEDVDI